ncbi:U3 small nucleolar RNA-associated protein 13 [Savitreella phatthalungensis]
MAPAKGLRSSYAVVSETSPIYTGGPVGLGGGLLATTLRDGVQITEYATGSKVIYLKGDGEPVTSIAVAPDGDYVVVASRSVLVRTYSLPSGKLLRSAKAHDAPVITLAIDSTSTLLATGGADGLVKVWDLAGGFVTHNFRGHGGIVSALRFYGRAGSTRWYLASGADDCRIRVWDLVKSTCVGQFDNGHTSVVRGLDFDVDGKTLVSAGRDQLVNIWDLTTMKLKASVPVYESIETVGCLPEGALGLEADLIFLGGERNRVRVLDLATRREVAVSADEATTEVAIQQAQVLDGALELVSVSTNQTIITHSLASKELPILRRTVGQFDEIIDVTHVLGGDRLAVASNSEDLHLLNPATNAVDVLTGHSEIILTIDTDYSGRFLATGAKDNTARIWDLQTQTCIASFAGHTDNVTAVALARVPTAHVLAKLTSGTPLTAEDEAALPETLYTASNDLTLKSWSPTNPKRSQWTVKAHDRDINAIDLSPDDSTIASCSQDRLCKLWDASTGSVVAVLKGHKRGVWDCRFSAHDKTIATSSGDRSIKIWALHDYTCIRTLEGHTNSVLKLRWLNAGRQLVSAGGDGLVKVWDAVSKTSECITTLDNHTDRVWSLSVSGDGKTIVSGGGDSVVTVWEDVTAETAAKRAAEDERRIEREQRLENVVRRGDWKQAIQLALQLDRPGKLLALFTDVLERRNADGDPDSATGLYAVDAVLQDPDFMLSVTPQRRQPRLAKLLERVRDWNTNARTSSVAQAVLSAVLHAYGAEELMSLSRTRVESPDDETHDNDDDDNAADGVTQKAANDLKTIVDPLLAYTERHYTRVSDLVAASYLVDFTLKEMGAAGSLIAGGDDQM